MITDQDTTILQSKKGSDLQLRDFSFSVTTDELVIPHRTR